MLPTDKTANNVVVVLRLYDNQTLKQELSGTRAYKDVSAEEHSVVNDHCSHLPLKFSVTVKDHRDKLPTMYWLHKHYKNI